MATIHTIEAGYKEAIMPYLARISGLARWETFGLLVVVVIEPNLFAPIL